MGKNLWRTIAKSLGRYLAIVAIIALGSAMFVGLRITRTDMIATGQKYTDEQNMFDLRLLNSYGWDSENLQDISQLNQVLESEGAKTLDVYGRYDGAQEDAVYRLHSMPRKINQVHLLGGRMPEKPGECLADGAHADDSVLGKEFTVSDSNDQNTLESLNTRSFTVVGYISTPLYMDLSRGTTSLGSGSLESYLYVPEDALNMDYFTEIYVTIPGEWDIYTPEYDAAMEDAADFMKPFLTHLAEQRFAVVKTDAETVYQEGMEAYNDGRREFEEGRQKAEKELSEALAEIQKAEAEIDKNLKELTDGETKLEAAEAEIAQKEQELLDGKKTLEQQKKEAYEKLDTAEKELREKYREVIDGRKEVASGLQQIDDALVQIDAGIPQVKDGLRQIQLALPALNARIGLLEAGIRETEAAIRAAEFSPLPSQSLIDSLKNRLAEQQQELTQAQAQRKELQDTQADLTAKLEEMEKQKPELEAKREELLKTQQTLDTALSQIESGFDELDKNRNEADRKFQEAEDTIQKGEAELENGKKTLTEKRSELESGRKALEEGQAELEKGRAEYQSGKEKSEQELAEAARELLDAEQELKDARKTLDDMKEPDVYALTRNTNVGYVSLDSNSEIVSGIANVLPVFFLLVASLVCITTMTRMVAEERTQIGTLKALGYSNGAIMSKYLIYSGSASVLGCGIGAVAGSIAFPWILWNAYGIILNITPNVVLSFDWLLALGVVAAYTGISSLVTWYSCRRTLKEVPAQLIRPKAPTSGKKILMERLPFWNKISFLNKVMFRNIFRYRQRMLMMLVGIGGCTALLVTGFGIQNSIGDIVDTQYEEITLYDLEVYFDHGLTQEEQEQFRSQVGKDGHTAGFFHQVNVDMEFGGRTQNINMIASDSGIQDFIHFKDGKDPLPMPGPGEAVLSVGAAELLGVGKGDTITVRDPDFHSLTLTVSGIYRNYVQNYLVVTPETIEQQWGEAPEVQMAFLCAPENSDVQQVGTDISAMDGVMNVLISENQAAIVNSMLDAMSTVVLTIVICAEILAIIVLYNLTNININERLREIATIKVLGFNARETSAYVFKENILLTVVGSLLGLGGGFLLLGFVMSQVKIDIVWFLPRITPLSYLISIVLTILSALIVDFIFYFRMDKINMAEALKSVE